MGLLLVSSAATATDHLDSHLRVSGYGTLGMTWDNRRDMSPMRDLGQRPKDVDGVRAGFATDPTWRMDSRVAIQLDYRLSPTAELVGQVVARDHLNATFANSVESTYLGLRPASHWELRIGRLGYDAFMMTDTRNLGYAYTWVRPPPEFYGWIPALSVNGIDSVFKFGDEDVKWRLKAQVGQSRFSVPMGLNTFTYDMEQVRSLTLSREVGPWRIKGGVARFTIADEAQPLVPLHNGLRQIAQATAGVLPQISAEAEDLAKNLSFKSARFDYVTVGAAYDDGVWLGQGELGRSSAAPDVAPHGYSAYFGMGRRLGNWTPYAMVASVRPAKGLRAASADWSAIGQSSVQTQALYVVNTTRMSQDTVTLGLRWDFHSQAALKLQLDSTRVHPSGYGLWSRNIDINDRSSKVRLLTLSVDFIF